jgi:hypothetical protein
VEGAFNKKHNGSMPSVCTSVCGPNRNPCCSFSEQELVDCTLGGADNCDQGKRREPVRTLRASLRG